MFTKNKQFGTKKEARKFANCDDYDQNIILSETERISLEGVKDAEYWRNENVLIIGGPGSGKSFHFVMPNLLQLTGSYIINDVRSFYLEKTRKLFEENGYQIRQFNALQPEKSMHYNPLAYIKNDRDIMKLASVLIENTEGKGEPAGEDFFVKAEKLLLGATIGYLGHDVAYEDCNIPNLLRMLTSENKKSYEDSQSTLEIMFEELEKENPDCFPVKQYHMFERAAGRFKAEVFDSVIERLSVFKREEIQKIMIDDELQLDRIGEEKTAFFVAFSDTDEECKPLIAMLYSQLLSITLEKADEKGGKLPIRTTFIGDDFPAIGRIPGFEKLMATSGKRRIGFLLSVQSIGQLKYVYGEAAPLIIDQCDSCVYMGGKSYDTIELISDSFSVDLSRVRNQKKDECLVKIWGEKSFLSKKYDITKHKRYSYLREY